MTTLVHITQPETALSFSVVLLNIPFLMRLLSIRLVRSVVLKYKCTLIRYEKVDKTLHHR
jgi:hypothetical protein